MVESKSLEVPHAFGTILYVIASIIGQYASLVNKKLSVLFLLQSHYVLKVHIPSNFSLNTQHCKIVQSLLTHCASQKVLNEFELTK